MCLLCGKYRKILPILSIIGNIIALSKKSNFVQSGVFRLTAAPFKIYGSSLNRVGK